MFTFFLVFIFLSPLSPRSCSCSCYCCCCRQQFVVCCVCVCACVLVSFRSPCHFPPFHFFSLCLAQSFVRFVLRILIVTFCQYMRAKTSLFQICRCHLQLYVALTLRSHSIIICSLCIHTSRIMIQLCVHVSMHALVCVYSITIANDAFTCKIVAAHLPMLQLLCCFR